VLTPQFDQVHHLVFLFLDALFLLDVGTCVSSVEDDTTFSIDPQVIHEQAHGTSFVKVRTGLLEQGVDGEL
jgi:hypothetical protein